MMWEKTAQLVGNVHYGQEVEKILWSRAGVQGVVSGGKTWTAEKFITTMPMRTLIRCLEPKGPDYLSVVENLTYRDFITVAVILKMADPFPGNWIYVHDEEVRVGRI